MTKKLTIPLSTHHEALKRKRSVLNTQVGEEMQRPLPDWIKVRALKARRLKTKDLIVSIQNGDQFEQGLL